MKRLKVQYIAIGYLLNYAILNLDWHGTIILISAVLYHTYWFFEGDLHSKQMRSVLESILIGNGIATVCIVFLLFHNLMLRKYLSELIGMMPQMFYRIAVIFTIEINSVFLFLISTPSAKNTCVFAFILMLVFYCAGYSAKLKKQKAKT